MAHHSENLSIRYYEQKFANLLSQGSIEQDYLSKSVKKQEKNQFWGVNKNINFSNEFLY